LFSKIVSINSLESQNLTADGDIYLSTKIEGLKPRTEYEASVTVIASSKSLTSNLRSIKTPSGITVTTSGVNTIIVGQYVTINLNIIGKETITSLRATGLPAGVTLTKSATGATITGLPRATGVYFVAVKLTDSFRQITEFPMTIVVNAVEAVDLITGGIYRPVSFNSTLISWKNISSVKQSVVKLGAAVVCTTTTSTCVVNQLLGPESKVQIIATSQSGSVANPVLPIYVVPKKLVQVGTANFATNSTKLTSVQKNALKKIAAEMEAKGFTQLTVYGYSDQTGTRAINDKISLARATTTYSYLKVLLSKKKLTVRLIGRGFMQPVASNATAAGRAANRRAVISIG
jgi:outer membrane protein OmpA-like peptidoglycan-associated protein